MKFINSVKAYASNKEEAILALVKKYPFYSVDKLSAELPNISRHSIQRVLEKKDLSTVVKRLAFSNPAQIVQATERKNFGKRLVQIFKKEEKKGLINRLKVALNQVSCCHSKSKLQLGKILLSVIGLALVLWQAVAVVSAKPPEIILEKPGIDFVNKGEKLFISGRVVPSDSKVTINNNKVALNGNGNFTAILSIPMAESQLEVTAVKRGRVAKLIRLVNRIPTKEESQALKDAEEKERQEILDREAELVSAVNDLMAAQSANAQKNTGLKILNNQIKKEAEFSRVVGEVTNLGNEKSVSWVMITAKFYDKNGSLIDTTYGFATDFGEVVKPGERADFETQATTRPFDYYRLELSWEEEQGQVAGAGIGGDNEASPSVKQNSPEVTTEL